MKRIRDKLTPQGEDYLKAVFDLTTQHARATTGQIAEYLGVQPASVTGMVKRLAAMKPPLVEHRRYRGVVLTAEGEKVALQMIRHHRLLETYLHEKLGYGWEEVHEEAERLEHAISEEFEARIAQVLDHPGRDPHGAPIPSRDLELPSSSAVPLSEVGAGGQARLARVSDRDPDLLRHLRVLGLKPGIKLEVVARSEFDDTLELRVTDQPETLVLGPKVTERILVEPL